MRKKLFSYLKKVLNSYGEMALLAYYPTGVIPNRKSWANGSTLSLEREIKGSTLMWWISADCKSAVVWLCEFDSLYSHNSLM